MNLSNSTLAMMVMTVFSTFGLAQSPVDLSERVERAVNFAVEEPESLGEEAFSVVEEAFDGVPDIRNLNGTDVEVLKNYTFALQRIGRAFGMSSVESSLSAPPPITNYLRELVTVDDIDLAYNAGLALVLLVPKDKDLERHLLDSLLTRRDSSVQNLSSLIGVLNWQPVASQEYSQWLVRQVSEAVDYGTAEAAALAFRGRDFPPGLEEAIIKRLEDPANYSNINLLELLSDAGLSSGHRSQLVKLKDTIELERSRTQGQRQVRFYNPDRTIDKLNEMIAFIDSI